MKKGKKEKRKKGKKEKKKKRKKEKREKGNPEILHTDKNKKRSKHGMLIA